MTTALMMCLNFQFNAVKLNRYLGGGLCSPSASSSRKQNRNVRKHRHTQRSETASHRRTILSYSSQV